MTNTPPNEYAPSEVSPPGETLVELLSDLELPQSELAARMGRPRKTINEIAKGKAAITPETALELELVLGTPASFWNARERDYRAHLARVAQGARFQQQIDWLAKFPVAALVKQGRIERHFDKEAQLRELLSFFSVASPEQWHERAADYHAAFRKSAAFESDEAALAAWLQCGVHEARAVDAAPFNKATFVEALLAIRDLTAEPPEVFFPAMQQSCAAAGVAVVLVPQLPKSRASGATRWLHPRLALIQLSLRYRTDDHFWFTFFHEAGHILLHGKRLIFLEDARKHEGELEEEANRWAADFLIPPSDWARFVARVGVVSKRKILAFAGSIGVCPGVVVGRLQHEGLLPHNHCNGLKARFEWVQREAQTLE